MGRKCTCNEDITTRVGLGRKYLCNEVLTRKSSYIIEPSNVRTRNQECNERGTYAILRIPRDRHNTHYALKEPLCALVTNVVTGQQVLVQSFYDVALHLSADGRPAAQAETILQDRG